MSLVAQQLVHVDFVDQCVTRVSGEGAKRVRPSVAAIEWWVTVPGIDRRTAEVLVAEIGVDVSRFPRANYLAAWAEMMPGTGESARKLQSGKTRRGVRG